jgi:CAAX protease family protein
LNALPLASDKPAQESVQSVRRLALVDVAQASTACSPFHVDPATGRPDDTWSADRWATWICPAAMTLLVFGTASATLLKPQGSGGQLSAFLSILALLVLLAALGLGKLIARPGAQRFIDIVTFERGPAVSVARAPPARKPWGFWPSLFWLGLGSLILVTTRNVWPGWSAWMAAGNDWAWRTPTNMLAWRLVQGLHEAALVVLPLVIAVRLAGWSQADYFALTRPRARWVAIGIACTLTWTLVQMAVIFGLSIFATGKGPWHANGTPFVMLWCASSFAILYAPILEELAYRGFLYRGLAQSRLGANAAIVVTAFIFALSHAYQGRSGLALMFVFGSGVLFAWLRKHSGSTLLPIGCHAFVNFADVLREMLLNLGWLS